MKKEKRPGSGGFTVEYSKLCFPDMGYFILKSIHHKYAIQEMLNTDKLEINPWARTR